MNTYTIPAQRPDLPRFVSNVSAWKNARSEERDASNLRARSAWARDYGLKLVDVIMFDIDAETAMEQQS